MKTDHDVALFPEKPTPLKRSRRCFPLRRGCSRTQVRHLTGPEAETKQIGSVLAIPLDRDWTQLASCGDDCEDASLIRADGNLTVVTPGSHHDLNLEGSFVIVIHTGDDELPPILVVEGNLRDETHVPHFLNGPHVLVEAAA